MEIVGYSLIQKNFFCSHELEYGNTSNAFQHNSYTKQNVIIDMPNNINSNTSWAIRATRPI